MPGQHTLGKQERLKSRKLIEAIFANGKKVSVSEIKIFYLITEAATGQPALLQLGVGVGTKNFKKAVHRNRIKRLLRESWRLNNQTLKKAVSSANKSLFVFIIYTGKEVPEFKSVEVQVITGVTKLQQALTSK